MIRWFIALCVLAAPLCAQSSADIRAGFGMLAKAHPKQIELLNLPGSDTAYAAVLRDQNVTGDLPAVLVLGSLHGDETAPAAACLELATRVLEDAEAVKLLSAHELIIIPNANPEARDLRYAKLSNAVPGVLLPHDDDRDGRTDEDGPSDINGDGVISQMRVKRAGGKYRVSKLDPRILIEAKPGEEGEYDLYWEGQDDDGDGRINEDAVGTVTLGNDWSIRWSDEQPGANRFMMQLKQTRALADFITPRRNIVAAIQLRSIGDGIEFAKGPKAQREDPYERDKQMQASIEKLLGEKALPGAVKAEPEGAGNVLDWLYESQGVYAANLYLASVSGPKKEQKEDGEEEKKEEPKKPAREKPDEAELAQQAWLAYAPGDYLEWKSFKHPQLGEVEIGGWKITARHDPSEEDAKAGAGKAFTFVKSLIGALPKLEVSKVEVEDKGSGLYRVRLTLHNAGALDYKTAFSTRNRIHMPLFVSVSDTKAVELVSATRRQETENLQADGTTTFEWLVRASDKGAELDFTVESDRCGKLNHKVAVKDCPAIKTEDE